MLLQANWKELHFTLTSSDLHYQYLSWITGHIRSAGKGKSPYHWDPKESMHPPPDLSFSYHC